VIHDFAITESAGALALTAIRTPLGIEVVVIVAVARVDPASAIAVPALPHDAFLRGITGNGSGEV
jgi:hypothetical protein